MNSIIIFMSAHLLDLLTKRGTIALNEVPFSLHRVQDWLNATLTVPYFPVTPTLRVRLVYEHSFPSKSTKTRNFLLERDRTILESEAGRRGGRGCRRRRRRLPELSRRVGEREKKKDFWVTRLYSRLPFTVTQYKLQDRGCYLTAYAICSLSNNLRRTH